MSRARGKGRASALFVVLLAAPPACDAAAIASGRNWRIAIESIACEAGSVLAIGARIHYVGPKGPVEAPVNRLVDGEGRPYLPKSLVWRSGDRKLAQWLPSGGIANLQAEQLGEFQFRFDVGGATTPLRLEFGDIKAFPLTRKGGCKSVLKSGEIEAPRKARPGRSESPAFRVYRSAYPCGAGRTIEADHPPHLPKQLLLFGHGFLPSARQIDLPMGKAPAQTYVYSGADSLNAIESAARQAVAADFPGYTSELTARKQFAFNWGVQRSQSGNDVYSIGIYDVRPCAR